MSDFPEPMLRIEMALKQWGGWSKIFRMSPETYDAEHVILREGDERFWKTYEEILVKEQFEKEVEECYVEYIRIYGRTEAKDTLKVKLGKALLSEGWKPKKTKILKELRRLRGERREQIRILKNSLRRK